LSKTSSDAAFGRDLSLVTRAETIRDAELRLGFAGAEKNFESGATVDAIHSLIAVFKKARSKWKAEHEDATQLTTRRPTRDEFGIVQTVEEATQYAEDMLLVAPFALDLGEYVWWQSLVQSVSGIAEAAPVSVQEVRRALAFVFTWILRWEAFPPPIREIGLAADRYLVLRLVPCWTARRCCCETSRESKRLRASGITARQTRSYRSL